MDEYVVGKNELCVLSWKGVCDIFKWQKQGEEIYRQQYSPPILFIFVFGKKKALYGCVLAC